MAASTSADFQNLLQVFTEEEILAIDDDVKQKIENKLKDLEHAKDELFTKSERLTVELEDATLQVHSNEDRLRALESNNTQWAQELTELRASASNFHAEELALETSLRNLENEKASLLEVLERRETELTFAREEISSYKDSVSRYSKELTELKVKLHELESSNTLIQSQMKRKELECVQLTEERNALDMEKISKFHQITRLQMEKSSDVASYHYQLDMLKTEKERDDETISTYKQLSEQSADKLRQEQAKHAECRDAFISAEESHRQELIAQKKLAQMYKQAEEKAMGELTEALKASEEFKECFQQLQTEYEETQSKLSGEIAELNELVATKDENLNQLQSELKRMNELMEENAESPEMTTELARLIKSGLTYSQLYHKYHQTMEQLTIQTAENNRINSSFDQLMEELDEVKPKLIQLRNAYDSADTMVKHLSEQLKANMTNLEQEARKSSDAKKQSNIHLRECNRFKLENDDLATQVQVLTKELHVAQGGRIVADDEQVSSSEGDSADVISTHLVSFRSIQELQKQNQQLRAALRELSEDREEEEKSEQSQLAASAVSKELQVAREEIEQLKQARLKHEELVHCIIKQRDTYKHLVEQGVAEAKKTVKPVDTTEVNTEQLKNLNKELEKTKHTLTKIKDEFAEYKVEKNINEQVLQDQVTDMRKGLTEQKLTNAKLSAQLDYAMESSKIMEKNVIGYKQEISALRGKAEQFSNLVSKNEAIIGCLRQEIMASKESINRAEISNHKLSQTIDIMRTNERRLQVEADTARKDYNLQVQMLSNLQSIQSSIEKNNNEMRMHYQLRIEQQEKDCQVKSKQVESLKQQLASSETQYKNELANWKKKHDDINEELTSANKRLVKSIEEVNQVQKQLTSFKQNISAAPEEVSKRIELGEEQAVDLKHAQSEIDSLKEQLRLSSEASDEYRQVADRLEQTLREQTDTLKQYEVNMEAKVTQLQKDLDAQSSTSVDLRTERDSLFEEKSTIEQAFTQYKSETTMNITQLSSELHLLQQTLATREETEKQAREDLQKSAQLNSELSEKYQFELTRNRTLHEEIAVSKNEIEQLKQAVTAAEDTAMKTEMKLQSNHASFEEREKQAEVTLMSVNQQLSDLKQQNTLLHQQVECMSTRASGKSMSDLNTSLEEVSTNKSSEQLLELVKLLKKDKELFETKMEAAEAESKRVQAKVQFLQSELQQAKDELAGERSQADIDIQTKAQHAELLRKVEQINLLTDSNRFLRQEKDIMQPRIDELNSQVAKLENEKIPLEEKIRELCTVKVTLEAEKTSLEEMVEHWRQRVNNLIEKNEKGRAEDMKKQMQEMEQARKTSAAMSMQIQKQTAELEKANKATASLTAEKSALQESVSQLEKNVSTSEQQCRQFTNELQKRETLINSLKKLGRKYKTEVELLKKKPLETLPADSAASTSSSLAADEKSVADLKKELSDKEDVLKVEKEKSVKLTEELEEANKEITAVISKLTEVEKELQTEKDKGRKLQAEFDSLDDRNKQLKAFVSENLQPRLIAQKLELQKHREDIENLNTHKTEVARKLEVVTKELNETKSKLQVYDDQSSQQQSSQLPSPRDIVNLTSLSGFEPKLANVKPMASQTVSPASITPRRMAVKPTIQQQQPHPMATVTPTSANVTAEAHEQTTLTDEPLVVVVPPTTQPVVVSAPATTVQPPPTTTVQPALATTVQSASATTVQSAPATTAQPAPTTTAQPASAATVQPAVATTVQPFIQSVESMESQEPVTLVKPSTSTTLVGVPSIIVTAQTTSDVTDAALVDEAANEVTNSPEQSVSQSTRDPAIISANITSSSQSEPDSHAGLKRTREDNYEDEGDAQSVKRSREEQEEELDVQNVEEAAEDSMFEQLQDPVISEVQDTITSGLEDSPVDVQVVDESEDLMVEEAVPSYIPAPLSPYMEQMTPDYSGADNDIIVIDSSDDDDNVPGEDEQGGEYEEDEGGEYDEGGESEEDTASDVVGADFEEAEAEGQAIDDGEGDPDDSDIMMLPDDQPSESENVSVVPAIDVPNSQASRSFPLLAVNSAANVSIVDSNVNDDGIVPCTPTLSQPRRDQSFAVAVSSPFSSEPFVFDRSTEVSTEHSLASQAEMMDDVTDITQYTVCSDTTSSLVPTTSSEASEARFTVAAVDESREEQSSVVSTETESAATTSSSKPNEEVSSSGTPSDSRTGSRRAIEPIVWDAPSTSQSDQPSSSSSAPPRQTARRGRGRGGRLNRPSFQ